MTPFKFVSPSDFPARRWSNRLLIVALAGILFLTLYPFRFSIHTKLPENASPFLLGTSNKPGKPLDVFLNVLLFIPFGFAFCAKLREAGMSSKKAWIVVWVAGAVLSYSIEFAQIYIPPRDSGWGDVLTNSTGSLLGGCFFLLAGSTLLEFFSHKEATFETWLIPARVALLFAIYFGLWVLVSVHWQRLSRLENWDSSDRLVIGNDASGHDPWRGTVNELQLWDRAIPEEQVVRLRTGADGNAEQAGLLADIPFSGSAPYHDRKGLLSPLVWTPSAPSLSAADGAVLDGTSWITSRVAVPELIKEWQRTNQFSIRVVLAPKSDDSFGRILSISQPSGFADLTLDQERAGLLFWFRNPLSARHGLLAWNIPKVFASKSARELLFCYDGANLVLYLDGKREPVTYRLTPGTALARTFRHEKAVELEGYAYIYYAFVFFPLGALLGVAFRRRTEQNFASFYVLVAALSLSPVILELALVRTSARPYSPLYLTLSFSLLLAGSLWVNADPPGPVATDRTSKPG